MEYKPCDRVGFVQRGGGGRGTPSTITVWIHLLAGSSGPYQVLRAVPVTSLRGFLCSGGGSYQTSVNQVWTGKWDLAGRVGRRSGSTVASRTAEVGWSRNTGWLLVANVTELRSAFLCCVKGWPGDSKPLSSCSPAPLDTTISGRWPRAVSITLSAPETRPPSQFLFPGSPTPHGWNRLPAVRLPPWSQVAFPKVLP